MAESLYSASVLCRTLTVSPSIVSICAVTIACVDAMRIISSQRTFSYPLTFSRCLVTDTSQYASTARLTLYRQTETKLNTAINTVSGKVDTINSHIDGVITDAPKKLKITVRASDADYQKMNDIIERHRKWVIDKVGWACGDFRQLLTNEWQKTRDRYKEYDGTYLGHYIQYFFWFFCLFGIVIFCLVIFLALNNYYHWTR